MIIGRSKVEVHLDDPSQPWTCGGHVAHPPHTPSFLPIVMWVLPYQEKKPKLTERTMKATE